jgi:hypothetical protein
LREARREVRPSGTPRIVIEVVDGFAALEGVEGRDKFVCGQHYLIDWLLCFARGDQGDGECEDAERTPLDEFFGYLIHIYGLDANLPNRGYAPASPPVEASPPRFGTDVP